MTTSSAESLARRRLAVGSGARDPDRYVPEVVELEMKAKVREFLNRWPAVGLAVGVVRNGSLEFFYGHGVADIASNTPITEDTVVRLASITKTFTAIPVMQLWSKG